MHNQLCIRMTVYARILLYFAYLKIIIHRLIQAGCSSENIRIVGEAAAVLHFCLNKKEDKKKLLDDMRDGKFLVVDCGG